MEPRPDRYEEMDGLLRRSMGAPVPGLPADFDQIVIRELLKNSQQLDRRRRILLIGYGLLSVLVSAVLMRGQGLGWGPIAGLILAPLALIAVARSADKFQSRKR